MNWTKVSAISDIIVAVSVIISLIYVAGQLEQNTQALKQTASISTTEVWTNQQILLARDAELNRIFWQGMKADPPLTEAEQLRFEAFMSGWVQAFQQSFLLHESGMLDSGLWHNQLQSMTWVFSNRGARKYWDKWSSAHVPPFVAYINTHVIEASPAAQQQH